MKKKMLLPATLALTAMILAGCGQKSSEENTPVAPATTNSADAQPAPAASAADNVIAPPPANLDTNSPALTNSPATNSPTATNQ